MLDRVVSPDVGVGVVFSCCLYVSVYDFAVLWTS